MYVYMAWISVKDQLARGRKEMFYLTKHSTHFICGYVASDLVKEHGIRLKTSLLPYGLLLSIYGKKSSFICTRIAHTTAFVHKSWSTGCNEI